VIAETGDDVVDESASFLAMTKEEGVLKAGEVKALQKEAENLDAKIAKQAAIEKATADIEAATERERLAQDAITAAKERLAKASVGINEWINNQQAGRDDQKKNMEDEKNAAKRADTLSRKQAAGTHLSGRDAQWLKDFNDRGKAAQAAMDAENQAKVDAANAKREVKAAQDRLERLQDRIAKATEGIETTIADAITVN
jgi:hypothetical protein